MIKGTCIGLLFMFCEFAEPPKTTTVVCPPVIEWSADLQRRAAGELRLLPRGSALSTLAARAIEQRDVNRRCRAAGTPN